MELSYSRAVSILVTSVFVCLFERRGARGGEAVAAERNLPSAN